MKTLFTLVASTLLSSAVLAQPSPPPALDAPHPDGPPPPASRDEGDRPGPHDNRDRGDRDDGPRGPRDGGGPGPGMRGPGGGGPLSPGMAERRAEQFERIRGYLDLVDRYAKMARDPAMSGIAAVVSANDILRPRGTDVAIEYFTKLLPEVKNPSVARAIRVQLVDLYRAAGQQDQALEQLKQIMTADTSNEPAAPPPPPGGPRGPGAGAGGPGAGGPGAGGPGR
jgi:hypothetical protein